MCTCAELAKLWTEEKCVELIRKFKENSVLWDTKNILFYKQDFKRSIWDDIGKELHTTGKECKHKMGILMSSFRREKAKFINGFKLGINYKSTWFGFRELSFLLDRRSPNQNENIDSDCSNSLWELKNYEVSSTNIKKPTTVSTEMVTLVEDDTENIIGKTEPLDQEEEFDEEDDGEYANDLIQLTLPEKHSIEPSEPNITNSNTYEQNFISTAKDPISTDSSDKMEEIVTFNNFIQAKMKKYSARTLSAVERAICDIIFKADQNYYENNFTRDTYAAERGTSDGAKEFPLKRRRFTTEVIEPNLECENSK